MAEPSSPESHDPSVMLRAALRGFDGARQRLDTAAVPGAPPERVFAPLAEALWWTVSVNDGFEELADTGTISQWPSKRHYQGARDEDPTGRVLVGLRYARDRCGHQLALVALEDGLRLPFRLPNVLGEFFRWRPSEQLPQPQNKNHQKQPRRSAKPTTPG
jgi:hypothetical protein